MPKVEVLQMPEPEYRAREEMSQSAYKRYRLPTPAHARWEKDHPKDSADALNVGTCLHALTLEGKRVYAVAPKADGRTTEGKKIKAMFAAENEGKIILSEEQGAAVEGMAAGIARNKAASLLLASATHREISIFWDGEKARLDAVCPLGVLDLKTTKSADPRDFSRAIEEFGYAIQGAHYLKAATMAGFCADDFYIIACESFGSFECAVYKISHRSLEIGRQELEELRGKHAECVKSGIFPGYPNEPVEIDLPIWKMKTKEGIYEY